MFESKVHDLPAPSFMTKPLKDIPDLLKADYLYDRRIQNNEWYIEENFPTNRTSSKFFHFFIQKRFDKEKNGFTLTKLSDYYVSIRGLIQRRLQMVQK